MKAYSIQARVGSSYIVHEVNALDDKDALNKFSEAVDSGEVKVSEEGFYDHKRVYLTFEETDYVEREKGGAAEKAAKQ